MENWSCPAAQLIPVDPAWRRLPQGLKKLNHLLPAAARQLQNLCSADWDAGKAVPELEAKLDCPQLDLAIWELIWRFDATGVVCLKSQDVQTGFLQELATYAKGHTYVDDTCLAAWTACEALLQRAHLCLVPLLHAGHWTLLVLERSKDLAAPAPAPASPALAQGSQGEVAATGCSSCHGKGCLRCCPEKAFLYVEGKDKEKEVLTPLALPVLPLPDYWTVKYFDSLQPPSLSGQLAASKVLERLSCLGLPSALPGVAPCWKQTGCTDCGWYCLHFAEECIREHLGEGPVYLPVDMGKRRERLVSTWLKVNEKSLRPIR